jgi:hypothetical protein
MAVYRVDGLVRTATSIRGWYRDTWTGRRVVWQSRSCAPGELRVPVRSNPKLFAGVTQHVRVSGDAAPLTYRLPSSESRTIVVHLRPRSGACRVQFDVSPVRRPVGDPRRLGVLIAGFEYVPAAA